MVLPFDTTAEPTDGVWLRGNQSPLEKLLLLNEKQTPHPGNWHIDISILPACLLLFLSIPSYATPGVGEWSNTYLT